MIAPTHIAFAALSVSLLGAIVNVVISPLALSFAALGALFPDIDTTASFIGRLFRPVALFLERRFGHRTITHSLLGTIIFAVIFIPLVFFRNKLFFICLILGYLSHILIDAVNKSGVPLFYPNLVRAVIPGNERFRITVGSKEEFIFLGILLMFTTFIIPLNRVGIRGALHYLVRTPQSAVTDYLNYSSEGYDVLIDFEGIFNLSQKRISGKWQAVGSTSKNSLIVKSQEGTIYSIGSNPQDNIRPLNIQSHKGRKLKTETYEIRLRNQLLSDVFQYIPKEGETYLLGHIETYDKLSVRFSIDDFNVLKVGVNRLDFLYAAKEDILNQNLSNILVLEGQILIRTIYKENEIPKPIAPIAFSELPVSNVITLYIKDIYDLGDELKVRPNDVVKKGDLLASLNQKRESLLLEKEEAEEHLKEAEDALKILQLKQKETLTLKEKEDSILNTKRDLSLLMEDYNLELSKAQSGINLAKLNLKKIEQKLKATYIYSSISGKILSIGIQHTTVSLRILAYEKYPAQEMDYTLDNSDALQEQVEKEE